MAIELLGKILLPNKPHWQRRRTVQTWLLTLLIGAMVSACLALGVYWVNRTAFS